MNPDAEMFYVKYLVVYSKLISICSSVDNGGTLFYKTWHSLDISP